MSIQLAVLLFLLSIIHARVLPAPNGYVSNPEGKIDDKKAAGNQEFLSAFLGNIKDQDGSDSTGFSAINSLNDPKDNGKDGTSYEEASYGYDSPSYSEPSYDGYGGYEHSYDDYSSGYNDKEIERMTRSYKASINCREFHHESAISPQQCHDVKVRDYASDYDRNNPNELAYCRWDMGFDLNDDKQAGCLCPRTKDKCHKKNQCYWYKSKHSDGDCVHNSERFYNILANLLRKRGKKDFALKIKYSSAGAKGRLPYGPWGPAFFDLDYEPYMHPQHEHAFNYNPYSNIYGMPHGHGDSYMEPMFGSGGQYNPMGAYLGGYGSHHNPIGGYGGINGGFQMPNSYNQNPMNLAHSAHVPLNPSIGNHENNLGFSGYDVSAGQYQSYDQPLPGGYPGVGPSDVRLGSSYDVVPGGNSHVYHPYAQQVPSQTQAYHSNLTPNPIQIPVTNPVLNPVQFASHVHASNPPQVSGHAQAPNPAQPSGYVQAPNSHQVVGHLQAPSVPNIPPNALHIQATNPIQLPNHVQATGPVQYGY